MQTNLQWQRTDDTRRTGGGREEEERGITKGYEETFGGDKYVHRLHCGNGLQV